MEQQEQNSKASPEVPVARDQGRARHSGLSYFEAFLGAFEKYLNEAVRSESSLSLVLFDIDWFGRVNQEFGRALGDTVIGVLANSLTVSTGESGVVLRYGGDAHMALLPAVEKEEAFLLAEQARIAFDREHVVRVGERDVQLPLTLSAGVASYPDDDARGPELIRKANEALYRAKVSGRNKVCLAREEKMLTKTSHYTQGQLAGLSRLAKREGIGEAVLLREALNDILRKYNS